MKTSGDIFVVLWTCLRLVGGMLFFSAVHGTIDIYETTAGIFWPVYPRGVSALLLCVYNRLGALLGAAGFLLRGQVVSALVLLLPVLVVTVWLWAWLIPYLNTVREAGNTVAFARGHRLSVWINGAELIAGLWLLIRTAI